MLLNFPCKVRARTVSFVGLGYRSAGFIDIECDAPLPAHIITDLEALAHKVKAEEQVKMVIALKGTPYPFGCTIGKQQ